MTTRNRTIVGVACLLVAIIAPWVLLISPKHAQASKLQSQINSVQSQLSSVQGQLAQGEKARSAFASSYTTLVKLGEAVPTDDNTPSLLYELQSAAQKSHVQFSGLTFDAGQGGGPSSTSTTPAASAGTLPPGATVGPAGFPVETFTFNFGGSFFHLANFLGRLQRFVVSSNQNLSVSGRLVSLNGITLAPGANSSQEVTATIAATTYLLPSNEGLTNGATPAGPATTSPQTVSNSSPASPAPPAVVTGAVR